MAPDRKRYPTLPAEPVILVTGASSGIGLALARKLRDRVDARIILTARSSSLPRFGDHQIREDERVWIRALDVDNAEERQAVVAEAEERLGGIDVLINNAGIAYRSVAEHILPDEALKQLSTNFLGPIDLVRLVLPGMRRKRQGRIINVSSVSGMMAMPSMGSYSGSKFALEGATESLWYEMKAWNIRITLVQPGFIHSNSFRNVILADEAEKSLHDPRDPYHTLYTQMGPFIEKLMNWAIATPDDIAEQILRTFEKPKPRLRVFATIDARFFYLLRRVLPRRLFHALLYRSLPGVRHWGPSE